MRTHLWRLASVVMLLALLLSPLASSGSVSAAQPTDQSKEDKGPIQVINASKVVHSEPLASIEPRQTTPSEIESARALRDRYTFPKVENANALKSGKTDPSIVQDAPVGNSMPATIANFEGVGNVNGVLPPDTVGDIGYDPISGNKYYMQWVNLSFQIWNVTNPAAPVSTYGPAAGNTLFTSLGGICASNNDGDPIVLFDQLANRWMVSQFALGFPNNFHQCIAVSASANPNGAWYLYDFQTSTSLMNDYPHFGVWPDGYYMTVNQFNGTSFAWEGAGVAVFERDTMLQGLASRMIYIDIGGTTLDYGGMLPTDLDGSAIPPVGTPNYFMEWDDSTWLSDPTDTLRVWEFDVDWANTANTTFGANASFDPNLLVPTADVNPELTCSGRSCIPQPGTSQGLDAIADRLMHRLVYRDFGTHQSIVGNHTVNAAAAGSLAGIHWFELRDTGTGFGMHQEGVYAPDTKQRWMGSIAMDASGNMALGYSISSSAVYPSIGYTGRLVGDPLNQLAQGETVMIAGGGSQTSTSARWGDYSSMTLDPQDDCTFWYTQEYYQTTSSAGWRTRIGSFKFPSCTTGPTGTLSGTVSEGATPIAGATVSVSGGVSTVTDASGNYAVLLPPGSYTVTASKYGYLDAVVPGVVITDSVITTQDFDLTPAATYTVSGVVTDSLTGWPLYARIDILGYPLGSIYTNPITGAYSVDLVAGPYQFTVTSLVPGYTNAVTPVVVASNMTQDFALTASAACTAPGYSLGTPLLSEGFETAVPPTGWNKYNTGAAGNGFTQGTTGTSGSNGAPHSGTYYAWHNDYTYDAISWLVTPQVAVPVSGASFNFWERLYYPTYYEYHGVWVTTGASPDPTVSTYVELWNGTTGTTWAQNSVDLSAYAGQNVHLAFRFEGNWADEWYLDDVAITGPCAPIPGYGLVTGSVFDENTSLFVAGASVESGSETALMLNASTDPATPPEVYVIALPSGSQSMTASVAGYGDDTDSVGVVSGSTVGHDFDLPAGQLSIAPASMTFNVTTAAPTDDDNATLSNTGGAAAGYEIFAINGAYSAPVPGGPFANNTRHIGPKNLNDKNASQLRIPPIRPYIPPLAAGDVVTSWNTGLTYAWGIGYNTTDADLWLSDILVGGGTGYNTRFTTAGVNTGDSINTASWVSTFNADMTYNPFTQTLWQVNVGGDNCIYEMDPATLTNTGNKICPAFGTSQRGLAYDPVSDTYFSGSWNDFIINRFTPDGTLLSAVDVNLEIAGLAYNPVSQHLFVLSNTDSDTTPTNYDITVLDAADDYAVVGGFNIGGATPVFADYVQAGLEIDCAGNLWAVDQDAQKVYVAASGETGVCNWLATWLSAAPDTGSVPAAGSTPLTVSVDATGMAAGTYQGYLRIANDTPYGDEILPVTMNVLFGKTAPADSATAISLSPTLSWNQLIGATSYEYCYSSVAGPCTKWNSVGSDTSVTLSGLAPNYTYYWQVRAVDSGGTTEADGGTWWSFTTTAASACTWPPYTPPATPTFGDVPMDVGHWSWVERLANSTITAGCGSGNYCPFSDVVRAQMAIFLLRGKHCGSSYTPPAVGASTGFGDVPLEATYAPWVKQLAAEGITAGCGGGNFCPLQVVNRAQMAIFVLRAKHGSTYSPPAVGATTGFGDVPLDATYAAWVKQLAAEGITAGCGGGNFCPLQNVNRAQMATFLVRAFGLP